MREVSVRDCEVAAERARERAVPEEWAVRLREISPLVTTTSHLRFRWLTSVERWALYQCIPRHLLPPDRVAQLRQHWSELPPSQQFGRQTMVSDYQFRMFHDFGVDPRKFWNIQGSEGGTPAQFTARERKLLHAQNLPTEVPPSGAFAYAPFDERVVRQVLDRDRLLQVQGSIERLRALDSHDAIKAEEEATEREFRRTFLDWYRVQTKPEAEFLTWYLRKKEADHTMRRATQREAMAAATYRDTYIETGTMPALR